MHITVEQQERMLGWAAKRLGTTGWSSDSRAYGIVEPRAGKRPLLRCVIVVNSIFGSKARLHIASDGSRRWATRDVPMRLSAFFHLVLDINRLSCIVSVRNLSAQLAALRLGFQIEGRERCGADDGSDGIVFSMLRDENPWLKGDDGE